MTMPPSSSNLHPIANDGVTAATATATGATTVDHNPNGPSMRLPQHRFVSQDTLPTLPQPPPQPQQHSHDAATATATTSPVSASSSRASSATVATAGQRTPVLRGATTSPTTTTLSPPPTREQERNDNDDNDEIVLHRIRAKWYSVTTPHERRIWDEHQQTKQWQRIGQFLAVQQQQQQQQGLQQPQQPQEQRTNGLPQNIQEDTPTTATARPRETVEEDHHREPPQQQQQQQQQQQVESTTDTKGENGNKKNSDTMDTNGENGNKKNKGIYTMASSTPYRYTRLFNRSLRLAHKVPDHIEGVLLNSVCDTAVQGQLQVGDVLTKVDDYQLESDGQIYFRGGDENLIQHEFVFAGKGYQEPVRFTVFRDGKLVECEPVVLHHIPRRFTLYPEVDHREEYLFIGPALFVPASYGLIYQGKEPDSILKGSIKKDSYLWPHEWKNEEGTTIDQFVLLIKIMAHDASFDYKRAWSRVTEYNGVPVQSLKHLRDLWNESRQIAEQEAEEEKKKKKKQQSADEKATEEAAGTTTTKEDETTKEYKFARIGLECSEELVFEVNTAMQAEEDVMKAHNIPKKSVILPPNPRYVWK